MAAYSIKALVLPSVPNNAGSVTPIEVKAPHGCILDAQPPSATGARFMDGSAWWLLIFFTVVGAFVLLYWFCQKGTTGPNRFGPDPLGVTASAPTR